MQRILDLFFSPHDLRDVLPDVWLGFQTNIHMMIVAEILVLIFALGIAVIRGLPGRAAIRCAPWPSSTSTSSAARR
jgi:hypothetical protein